jgi:thiosulfate dehydrogenase (quinone) large subunit
MIDKLVAQINGRFPASQSPTWPIALARISLGFLWLASLRWKLPPDFEPSGDTTGLRTWLELEVAHPAFGFYGDLIDSVVLPNFTVFAWLVFLAELGVGLALLLGVGTRPAALVGLLMSTNLLVGLLDVPGEWPWSYLMMIMLHGIVLVSNSHSLWSVAARLSSPRPTPARN